MQDNQLERKSDTGTDKAAEVRLWLKEIDLASEAEESWRKYAKNVLEVYEGETQKRFAKDQKGARTNEFNILWSNTETLKPALYNSTPRPDVRKRFKDKDPVGRAVAEVLERSVSYTLDAYDFDAVMEDVVHDYLLPGRGVARIRYVPTFVKAGTEEKLVNEEVRCEIVEWDRVRVGYAKRWDKVPWVAFEHELTRDEVDSQFGDVGKNVGLDIERKTDKQEEKADVFKRARVWEIWDKEKKRVLFVAPSYKDGVLKEVPDPLGLKDFFPIPRPLYAVQKTDSLIPTAEYSLYEAQAEELDRITKRINRIINALKVRGVYDSTIKELGSLFDQDDNSFIPATDIAAIYNNGGLDKSIWMLPIDKIIVVLKELVQQREQIKAVIYEITGIADVLRGASDPNETLGAQEIKQNWAGLRLKRRQKDVQRFVRDLIRMKCEVIAEKFSPQTIMQMTGIQFPTHQQKQQIMQAAQAGDQNAQQMAQQVALLPSIEEVVQILHSDASRNYRIDIETDSTIEGARQEEQKNLAELFEGMTGFINTAGPAVQTGLLPPPAVKAMLMAAVRRFKLGRELEDELDKIGEQPVQNPEMEKEKQELDAKAQEVDQAAKDVEAQKSAVEQDFMKKDFDLKKRDLEVSFKEKALALHTDRQKEKEEATKAKAQDAESKVESWEMVKETAQQISTLLNVIESISQAVNELSAEVKDLSVITKSPKPVVYGRDGRIATVGGRPVAYKNGRLSVIGGLDS